VPHQLPSAFQQTLGIGNPRTTKESDINVLFERIHVAERRISYTRSRMPIMQYLSNVFSTAAHDLKPMLRDRSQFSRMLFHPGLNRPVPLDRTRESEKLAHGHFISMVWLRIGMSTLALTAA
jgi:hypothetical protein